MRPSSSSSSSSDPNAPYLEAIASLADCNFFAPVEPAQADTTLWIQSSEPSQPFAALSARRSTDGTHLTPMTHPAPAPSSSSSVPVTINSIQQYLTAMGHGEHFLRDSIIESRLDSGKLSAQTVFNALQIAHDSNHPFFVNLPLNIFEQVTLINKLVGIFINASGFRKTIQTAAINSNDDPCQLIRQILRLVRG